MCRPCVCVGDQITGREVLEEIGMVSAAAVRSKSVLSDMYVALAGLFGGASLCLLVPMLWMCVRRTD